jgi:hypothetical protein
MKKVLIPLLLLAATLPAFAKDVLPFIENDYPKAIARAKAKDIPLFVDAWAPW